MSRRRWVYTEGGVPLSNPYEVSDDWDNALPRAQVPTEELTYGGLRATDGADISSRKKHREYMKQNGLAMASDFTEHWKKAEQERIRTRNCEADTHGPAKREFHEAMGKAWFKKFRY